MAVDYSATGCGDAREIQGGSGGSRGWWCQETSTVVAHIPIGDMTSTGVSSSHAPDSSQRGSLFLPNDEFLDTNRLADRAGLDRIVRSVQSVRSAWSVRSVRSEFDSDCPRNVRLRLSLEFPASAAESYNNQGESTDRGVVVLSPRLLRAIFSYRTMNFSTRTDSPIRTSA